MAEADPNDNEASARQKLIELIEAEAWEFTKSALEQGKVALKSVAREPIGEYAIIEYIFDLLNVGFPMSRTLLGEPPGSGGIGWVMNNPDGKRTYIKLKIDKDERDESICYVLSCKTSKHHKK